MSSPTFLKVRSECGRIISSHSLHFYTLGLLLFPFCFIITSFSFIHSLREYPVIFAVTSALAVLLLFIISVHSVTFSAFHAITDRPVSFKAILKSLPGKIVPLLITVFISLITQLLLCSLVALLLFLGTRGYELMMGIEEINCSSPYLVVACSVLILSVISVLLSLQASWSLACVIVVVDEDYRWGMEPLLRSATLMKNEATRRVAVLQLLLFWIVTGCELWLSFSYGSGPTLFPVAVSVGLHAVGHVMPLALVLLCRLIGNTVLYLLCIKMDEAGKLQTSAGDYVCLVIDQGSGKEG